MPVAPLHILSGVGVTFHVLGGDRVTLKLTGAETGGAFTLLETTVPAGGGPPPHVHHREDETFYIIESEFEFYVAGNVLRAGPGDVLFAPRDVPHFFRNVGAGAGTLVIMTQPAGFEHFIAEFATLPPDQPPDLAQMAAIAARHGLEFLPP